MKRAFVEYNENQKLEKDGKPTHYSETLQCFCKNEKKKGVKKDKKYK